MNLRKVISSTSVLHVFLPSNRLQAFGDGEGDGDGEGEGDGEGDGDGVDGWNGKGKGKAKEGSRAYTTGSKRSMPQSDGKSKKRRL